nr:MAG TPA: hypothetical protein [Caudoviricetes sp.]
MWLDYPVQDYSKILCCGFYNRQRCFYLTIDHHFL